MKSVWLKLILLFLIQNYSKATAQVVAKQLPQPRFYIFGVKVDGFPRYNGNWNDSISLKKYGVLVIKWIEQNEKLVKSIEINKTNAIIDHHFFKGLNHEEKLEFKNVSKQMAYVLAPQKQRMLTEFQKNNSKIKGENKDFNSDIEQCYFLHQDDLIDLKKKIKY